LGIIIGTLKAGQGVEPLLVSLKNGPEFITFGQQLFDRRVLLVDISSRILES